MRNLVLISALFTSSTVFAMSCENFSGNYKLVSTCEETNYQKETLIAPGATSLFTIGKNQVLTITQTNCNSIVLSYKVMGADQIERTMSEKYTDVGLNNKLSINNQSVYIKFDHSHFPTETYKAEMGIEKSDNGIIITTDAFKRNIYQIQGQETFNSCELKKI